MNLTYKSTKWLTSSKENDEQTFAKKESLQYYSQDRNHNQYSYCFYQIQNVCGYHHWLYTCLEKKRVNKLVASRELFLQCNNTQSEKEWLFCMAEVGTMVANLFPAY